MSTPPSSDDLHDALSGLLSQHPDTPPTHAEMQIITVHALTWLRENYDADEQSVIGHLIRALIAIDARLSAIEEKEQQA